MKIQQQIIYANKSEHANALKEVKHLSKNIALLLVCLGSLDVGGRELNLTYVIACGEDDE